MFADPITYRVDGEVGRFEFTTHWIEEEETCVYNTSQDVFPGRTGKEWYKTSGFKELAMIYGSTAESYRKTSGYINRIRHQQTEGTPSRSLREQTTVEGEKLMQAIARKTQQILRAHQFTDDGRFTGSSDTYQGAFFESFSQARVARAIAVCQEQSPVNTPLSENPIPYEAPASSVDICIDDVGTKRQKAQRAAQEGQMDMDTEMGKTKTRKYVHTTVIHLGHSQHSYILTGHGLKHALNILLAFLLNSWLLQYRLQFFTDGYTILQKAIRRVFSWYPNLVIILDWYHLKEKCKLQLSLAMTGRTIRNDVLKQQLPLLWYGLVDHAIDYIKTLEQSDIKNPEAIEGLVGYFERNRAHIPCYAVRKELGLRNSSQLGEKMNDLVVADRQKHNGMSWSVSGSVALASLTALGRNNEHARWFEEGDLEFKLAA